MESLLLIAGLVVFGLACRTFENRYVAKLGWLAMLGATYAGGFYLSGHRHLAGAAAVACWFLLPWVEILFRVRKLRFPLASEIEERLPPSKDDFPNLDELSAEVEDAGFVEIENAGWQWDETEHFMRLFYHKESRAQASVSLAQQDGFGISYVSVTSRSTDGRTFTSSNYPFSYTMKFTPDHHVNRLVDAESFEDLMESHCEFLAAEAVEDKDLMELDSKHLTNYLKRDMESQIKHNVNVGVLEPADDGENIFRYSWRGYVFLWLQIVKDMMRV
jgi:hypothetical protein